MLLTDCQYADDDSLLSTTTRSGATMAVNEYVKRSEDFGLFRKLIIR